MPIYSDFLNIADEVNASLPIAPVESILVNPVNQTQNKSSKFGAIVLADGTVGLTYIDLGNARAELQKADIDQFIGEPLIGMAQLYAGESDWQRVLGMAAINAFSQTLFRTAGLDLDNQSDTTETLSPISTDHIGMVGYFPPLVEKIRQMGIPLSVIELDPDWIQDGDNFLVTTDTRKLSSCNKIICTGTTLINHTLEDVLQYVSPAAEIHLVGPTVGCLPDPLFERGVHSVGGRQIVDGVAFEAAWNAGESWRAVSRRYTIRRDQYPGYQQLLNC